MASLDSTPAATRFIPWSRRLATVLIEDTFGEVVADVAAVLVEHGAMTLDGLLAATNSAATRGNAAVGPHSARGVRVPAPENRLTRRQVCECVLILIQHNLVSYELRDRETAVGAMSSSKASKLGAMPTFRKEPTESAGGRKGDGRNHFYALELRAVFRRIGFPRIAAHARARFGGSRGEGAATLLVAVHCYGCLKADAAVDAALALLVPDDADLPRLRAELSSTWQLLAESRYVARVNPNGGHGITARAITAGARVSSLKPVVDLSAIDGHDDAPAPAAKAGRGAAGRGAAGRGGRVGSGGRGGRGGRGAAKAAAAAALWASTETVVAPPSPPPPPPRAAADDDDDVAMAAPTAPAAGAGAKRRRAGVVALVDDSDSDGDGAASARTAALAASKAAAAATASVRARARAIDDAAHGAGGSSLGAGSSALGASGGGAGGAGGAAAAAASEEVILWRIDTEQFFREFRHRLIVNCAAQKCSPECGLAVSVILGALRGEERTVSDTRSSAFTAFHLAQRVSADLSAGGHQRSGLVMAAPDMEQLRAAAEAFADPYDSSAALSAAARRTAADAAAVFGSVDELVPCLEKLAHDPLRLISLDKPTLSSSGLGPPPVGAHTPLRVEMAAVIAHVRTRSVEQVVAQRFGERAARLMRVVRHMQKADEKVIAAASLLPVKECRALLYQLMQAGYAQLVEVPKSAERTPQRTIYLWSTDLNKALASARNELLSALLHVQLRLRDERRQVPPSAPGGASATQGPRVQPAHASATQGPLVQRMRRLYVLESTAAKLYEALLVYYEY
jgi:hypothetical protein